MGTKRRRIALSCVDCRKRKVKCDRTEPICIRCQKGGKADSCTYVPYEDGRADDVFPTPTDDSPDRRRDASVTSWERDATLWQDRAHAATMARSHDSEHRQEPNTERPIAPAKTLQRLEERLEGLETFVRSAGSRPFSGEPRFGMGHPSCPSGTGQAVERDFEQMMLRGRAFKTQYFGPTYGICILLQFEELSAFVKDILLRLPALKPVKETMREFRKTNERPKTETPQYDIESLCKLVLERSIVDLLVKQYFDTFETTYRVLHVPSFMRRYEEFWRSPLSTPAEFVIQLLLVMATCYTVVPGGPRGYIGRSSLCRETAKAWIDVAEAWVNVQSQKHITFAVWQIHVLMSIAKKMNQIKVKREWTSGGLLLRMGMSAGFHREPTFLSNKISVFDQEMRRRLWYTMLEIELETCVDRGMPSTISPVEWDCEPPRNIHDEFFDESSTSLPNSHPLTTFTRTTFLCCLAKNIGLRTEILSQVNSIRFSMDLDSVVKYDEKLRMAMDQLPHWDDSDLPINQLIYSKVSLKLIVYEFILILHQSHALTTTPKARDFFSRVARREAALFTLQAYADLPRNLARHLVNYRNDTFRAAMTMCHDLCTSRPSGQDLLQNKFAALELVEKTVGLYEDRVRDLGQGFHSYWLTSSALSLAYSKQSPSEPIEKFAQQAADRVSRLHDRELSLQQKTFDGRSVGSAGNLGNTGTMVATPASSGMVMAGQPPPSSEAFEGFVPTEAFDDPMLGFPNFDMTDMWNLEGIFDL